MSTRFDDVRVEERLRDAASAYTSAIEPAPDAWLRLRASIDDRRVLPRYRRRRVAAIAVGAAVAVAVVVAGAVVVVARNDSTREPQVSASARAGAEEVARGFLDAYGAFDADRAMTYLTKHALAAGWRTPAEFRLELRLEQATGWQQTIRDCTTGRLPAESAAGVTVYCAYDYQGLRSNEIGRGPYEDAYWAIVVKDGRIVSAENRIDMAHNGFDGQVRQPFRRWVWFAYRQDAAAMYKGVNSSAWKRSDESVRLWEQHTREYVTAGAPYIARARAICTAAHDRLAATFGPAPTEPAESERSRAYAAMSAQVLEETLAELRAVPPPEPFRVEFDRAYRLGDQLVGELRGEEPGDPNVRHALGGQPGLSECTFDLPG